MQVSPWRSYLWIGLAIVLLVSIPLSTAERVRGWTVALLSPLWQRVNAVAVVGNGATDLRDIRQPLTTQETLEIVELEILSCGTRSASYGIIVGGARTCQSTC